MLTTRLTETFDLQFPILSAPMAGHSGGRFAAAVSNAGALGLFGAATMTADELQRQIETARSLTDRRFGVGFITAFLGDQEDLLDVAVEARVGAILLSFDDPRPWVARVHDAGIPLICQVQTPQGAAEAIDAGAAAIVVQGREAGGHTGSAGLLPLLDEVLETYPEATVIAAGGIATGRTLAAMLAMGADGALIGTRLLATTEAETADEHKRLIVESNAEDTVFTSVFDIVQGGRWPRNIEARLRRNRFTDEWTGRERELEDRLNEVLPLLTQAQQTDLWGNRAVYMGTGVSNIHSVEPIAAVIRSLCDEAERRLSRSSGR